LKNFQLNSLSAETLLRQFLSLPITEVFDLLLILTILWN